MADICLTFQEPVKLVSKIDHFTFQSAMYVSSSPSTFLPTLGMVSLLNFNHSDRFVVVISCHFNVFFPND